MTAGEITAEMRIPDIVSRFPQTRPVFERYGLRIDGYKALDHETLFATSRVHQLPLEELLEALNQTVRSAG